MAIFIWTRNASLYPLSAARRVRHRFMWLGLTISILAFVVVAGDVLLEQWIGGHTSASYIFGTACVIGGACMALFALIAGAGLAISRAFSDEPTA